MQKPATESSPANLPMAKAEVKGAYKKLASKPIRAVLSSYNGKKSVVSAVPQKVSGGSAKAFIYQHESGNNPSATNSSSGACGLGQALPCSKMPCSLSDYACQDNFFTAYMLERYGSWENAKTFWIMHNWW